MNNIIGRSASLVSALALVAPLASAQVSITDPGQGPFAIADPSTTGASELSGLVKTSTVYQTVGDNATTLFDLSVNLNPNGTIASADLVSGAAITGTGADLEGVAYVDAGGGPVPVVVSEAGPQISLLDPGTLAQTAALPLPTAYTAGGNYNAQFGLESLAAGPSGALYTANEQALTPDVANRVRIQRYTPTALALGKQVAYELTSPAGDFLENPLSPGTLLVAANGVVDLAVLPNGDLLVLERALGFTNVGLQTRATISHVAAADFAAATDTLGAAALTGTETAAAKTQLWQAFFSDQNYEGLALGDTLGNGDLSLLLVSDDGQLSANTPLGPVVFNPQQTLYALTVTVPEPASAAVMLGTCAMVLMRRR